MLLGVYERLILLNILPPEDNLTTMRVIHGLKQRLSFTEEEHDALQFVVKEAGRVEWRQDGDGEVEIEIGSKAEQIIREILEKLSKDKKLKPEHLGLCDKFRVEE